MNWGLSKGTENIKLYVNGTLVDSKPVTLPPAGKPVILYMADKGGFTVLPPAGTEEVSFTYKFTEPGDFEVSTKGLTETVRVVGKAEVMELALKFITFDVNQPVRVYVARDTRLESDRPLWLKEFKPTDMVIETSDVPHRVYERDFPAGEIQLGVNWAMGGSMYFVLVEPLGGKPLKITNLVPTKYQVSEAKVGAKMYIDRGYTLTKLPPDLKGLPMIMTANNDKKARMGVLQNFAAMLRW